jgi:hypothetical protein
MFFHHTFGSPVVGIGSYIPWLRGCGSGAASACSDLVNTWPSLPTVSNLGNSAPKKGPSEVFTI